LLTHARVGVPCASPPPATVPIDLADFGEPRVGPVLLSKRRFGVGDLPAFSLIGFGGQPVGVLGMDALGGKRVVFDFRNSLLYIA
jgi:hypothetical protein